MKNFVFLMFLISYINVNVAYAQTFKKKFVVVQSMHYKGGVDVSKFGVEKNPIIYESSLLLSTTSDEIITGISFEKLVAGLEKGPLPTVIDIERWSIYTENEVERIKNRDNFLDVLKRLRFARPDLAFGYYGVIPERTYWPLIDKNKKSDKEIWENFNARARIDFSSYVDAIYPSLYTFYEDQKGWRNYAVETLKAAQKFGKPVYCYLWPQYHSSNKKLNEMYLSVDYWQIQLETCYQYSDGIVIWNYEPDKIWDSNADWWQQTLKFLKYNNLIN